MTQFPVKDMRPTKVIHQEHGVKSGHQRTSLILTQVTFTKDIGTANGVFAIELCSECPHVVNCKCMHTENEWNEAGTILSCTVCGSDGT